MYISNQTFLILGVSKSGFAVSSHVLKNGGKCYVYEEKQTEKISKNITELLELGAKIVDRIDFDSVLELTDVVVLSPGVPINHEIAVKAKRMGIRIMGELEFAISCFSPTIIGVTGTNGKTTTCNMIETVLTKAKINNQLVGNVGVPLTSKLNSLLPNEVCVCEVSSFQLETTASFCPHVSCILNIAPDHLERHYNMDNYVFLKKRIFINQKSDGYCVLNYDDQLIREFSEEVRAKTIWVSVKEKVDGAYLIDDNLAYNDTVILKTSELPINGVHNVYNALFTIAVCKLMGVDDQTIANGLREFKGVKHRIENVGIIDGVTYFDDSKGTNVASTISAIDCMTRPTVLILGGSEKGENYDALFEKIKEGVIKHVFITGASRFNMLESAGRVGVGNITITSDFNNAVTFAKFYAKEGENVLLSPACASFDQFTSYEERGNAFRNLIGVKSE